MCAVGTERALAQFGAHALIYAAAHANVNIVRMLLKAGADINHYDKDGFSAVLRAITMDRDGRLEPVINLLVENGAKIPKKYRGAPQPTAPLRPSQMARSRAFAADEPTPAPGQAPKIRGSMLVRARSPQRRSRPTPFRCAERVPAPPAEPEEGRCGGSAQLLGRAAAGRADGVRGQAHGGR
jgi:hypothetical protein